MARRAVAPRVDVDPLAHDVEWGVANVSALWGGERRLEASSYLADGYGRRIAIQSRTAGWVPLERLAKVWQPGRLTGVVVAPENGVPYLAAGQVFDARPRPRRWLAAEKTKGAADCFVAPGTLLVSRSGTVGKVAVAHRPHLDRIISDDLIRVEARDEKYRGLLYAQFRTEFFRSMLIGAHYGHVVKHVEVSHLNAMPLVQAADSDLRRLTKDLATVVADRERAAELTERAEDLYAHLLEAPPLPPMDVPFSISATEIQSGRRRIDAFHFNPAAAAIEYAGHNTARRVETLRDLTAEIRLPGRFKRFFGENGTTYRSAEELFELNAPVTKRIYAGLVDDAEQFMLHQGWIVMACSGQLYGLNGAVTLLTKRHEGVFATHDLIRLIPAPDRIRTGYLLIALGHPELGRPMVIRNGYGTSIPHLADSDVARIPVFRYSERAEAEIADLAEEAARLRDRADALEDSMTDRAARLVQDFLRG